MTIQLSDRFDLSRLFRFTLPSIVMMLVTSIYSVVDGLFVSNLVGDQALAAVNIVYPLVMIVGAFGFMLGAGGSAEVAKARGLGEDQLAKEYFTNLIITVVVGGAILAGACLLFQKPLLGVLGASEALTASPTGRSCWRAPPSSCCKPAARASSWWLSGPRWGWAWPLAQA